MYIRAEKEKGSGLVSGNNNIVHPSAAIEEGAIVENSVIGPDCKIASGARIMASTILGGTKVQASSLIMDSIIGWKNDIGRHARMTNCCTGEDV